MRRSLWFVWLTLSLLLFGVGYAGAAGITVTHLGYAGHGVAWREYVAEAAQEFMRLNPDIKIDIIETPSSEYVAKMQTMYAAGAGLDVVELGLTAATHAARGMYLDLRPLIESDPDISLNLWPEPVINSWMLDEAIWGLPASLALWMTWYNEDLFNQAGVLAPNRIGAGWTWDYLIDAAKKMTVDVNNDGVMEQYGVDRPWAYWSNGLALMAGGARPYEKFLLPEKPNVNSPEMKNAMQFVADIMLTHRVSVPYNASNASQYYFWTGKSAIDIVDNPGIVGAYMKNVTFNWDVARPVAGPGGSATHLQMDGMEIMSNTQHPEAAWKWLKFLLARKESVERFVELTGRLPAFKGAHAKYKELVPYAPNSWVLLFETMGAPTTYPIYVHKVTGLNQWKSGTIMGQVFTGQKAVSAALDEAQEIELANVKAYFDQLAQASQ
jgi:multiple sugar transport system substrate-binding protein